MWMIVDRVLNAKEVLTVRHAATRVFIQIPFPPEDVRVNIVSGSKLEVRQQGHPRVGGAVVRTHSAVSPLCTACKSCRGRHAYILGSPTMALRARSVALIAKICCMLTLLAATRKRWQGRPALSAPVAVESRCSSANRWCLAATSGASSSSGTPTNLSTTRWRAAKWELVARKRVSARAWCLVPR